MTVLKNKHIITAALVAPLLALISYYSIDFFVAETPHAAAEGESYKLVEKPNCRYESGSCGLKNGDFELVLIPEWTSQERLLLTLRSELPLEGAVIALVEGGRDEKTPADMFPASGDGLVWTLEVSSAEPDRDRLHLVAAAAGSFWYGDVAMKFALSGSD